MNLELASQEEGFLFLMGPGVCSLPPLDVYHNHRAIMADSSEQLASKEARFPS